MAFEVDDGQAWERAAGAASLPLLPGYVPRSPESTVLHRVVREHLATFLEEARARSGHGFGLPGFVEREFRDYLGCGVLARGFARVGGVSFQRLPPPDDDDVEALVRRCASRVLRLLRRELDDDEPEADALAALEAASLKARPAANGDGPKKKPLTAFLEGFSLHAGVHLHANDRRGLEQLCRYGACACMLRPHDGVGL